MYRILLVLLFAVAVPLNLAARQQTELDIPHGILMGEEWHPVLRELKNVYPDQSLLDLGDKGVRKVQFWVEVRNAAGREFTWVVKYSNGMKQKIVDQKIRYDRFRTYIEKTFRRNIWDARARELTNVSGPCKVMLIDSANPGTPIAVKDLVIQ